MELAINKDLNQQAVALKSKINNIEKFRKKQNNIEAFVSDNWKEYYEILRDANEFLDEYCKLQVQQ